MKQIPLSAKYRPQTFQAVVGQDIIKNAFSKAVLTGQIAPAYLLSGTRGVGKTTIARVFAKALNCENGPAAEPCNTCSSCLRITQGAYVDVLEIDGASNRGIEDAKRIRETVQFAPLEGRYKVIIIDEAHMLTREAFNALLKTLEEPPSHTTFVLATTEAHKFPITIVSRCQHYVFKQVPEQVLANHLKFVLNSEQWQYDEEAINLIAKRAFGSVRDAMSLLGQTLALAENPLTNAQVRGILGLAGKEITDNILQAILEENALAVATSLRSMLEQGVDISFFLREFALLWRSLFLLKKYQEQGALFIDIAPDEKIKNMEWAKNFSLPFIHSAWQMTLDVQRRILTSLEPATALELFLINLCLLPQLLPLPNISPEKSQSNYSENTLQSFNSHTENKITNSSPNLAQPDLNNTTPPSLPQNTNTNKTIQESPQSPIENNASPSPKKETRLIKKTFSYHSFLQFLEENDNKVLHSLLKQGKGNFLQQGTENFVLTIDAPSPIHAQSLSELTTQKKLNSALEKYTGQKGKVLITTVEAPKSKTDLKEEFAKHPTIQELNSAFNGFILDCEPKKTKD